MNRNFFITSLLTILGLYCIAHASDATAMNEWVFCNSCSVKGQFENAAIAAMNRTGYSEMEVANPISGVVWKVAVSGSNQPGDPLRPSAEPHKSPGIADDSVVSGAPGPIYVIVNWSFAESAAFNAEFAATVEAFKRDPLWALPPSSWDGFGSFHGRDTEAVNAYVLAVYDANNPTWPGQEINPNLLESLANSLMSLFGKGPTVCLTFENGDSACFQLRKL